MLSGIDPWFFKISWGTPRPLPEGRGAAMPLPDGNHVTPPPPPLEKYLVCVGDIFVTQKRYWCKKRKRTNAALKIFYTIYCVKQTSSDQWNNFNNTAFTTGYSSIKCWHTKSCNVRWEWCVLWFMWCYSKTLLCCAIMVMMYMTCLT